MKVAIITEGFQGTGYGHLTRCLSIYQAFEERRIIPLYIANCDEEGKKFIPGVNLMQLNWLDDTEKLIERIQYYDIVVIDSYLAPIEIYERIHNIVKKTVYIDDYIRLDYPPGIIVNGTVGAEKLPYKNNGNHNLLLGIEYIPLRKEFWDVEIPKRKSKVENVLVIFGAQDTRNLTSKILLFLVEKFPQFNYYVILGKRTPNKIERDNIHYYYSLNAKEMLDLMLKTDLVITAAGQTIYELARVGLPTIAIGVAENQKYNLNGFKEIGFIKEAIWYDDNNLFEKVERNIKINKHFSGRTLVDGQGARKIIENALY